jgi:hypothetical protein
MQVFENEVMQVAGFMVTVLDIEYDKPQLWHYGMFDTYDEASVFVNAYPRSLISPIYKPVTH